MRPQRNAAEYVSQKKWMTEVAEASMRPQRNAAEYRQSFPGAAAWIRRFNEAAA